MWNRLHALLNNTVSDYCKEEVTLSFEAFVTAHLTETLLPFESPFLEDLCARTVGPSPVAFIPPEHLHILYVVLAHHNGAQLVRLMEALQDPGHVHFVVHVDGKFPIPPEATEYAARHPNVFVMETGRVNVTWAGFSIVEATLNAMAYALKLELPFHRVINLSGAHYPVATPLRIRQVLASASVTHEFMSIDPKPNVPAPKVSDSLRSIYSSRLAS
jgi:hypothetical protein